MSQRNLPASFWNCNYQPPQSHHLHHNHFQSNLVSDHSHHYLPLIEPSASSASLQPLLQLETLSQLTHLQNHHHSQNSSAASSSAAGSFTSSSQHSAQNSSSLISNPINSLTFAHQQQQLAQSAAVQPSSLPQQQANSASQQAVADLSAQPPFLQFLQQQSNHPFQYAAAQNAAAAAIQSSEPASNTLANSQSHLQQHHSNLAHHYNGSETPTNNGWPHSVFIPLASPASSSSCSSNAENNANRSNKLASNSSGSLAKQYDHLAKPAARFASLTSSALLQLNSTGTSPNRSPLSTTTSSPAQISHNSSTLSPVAFHHSSSSNAAYQLSSSLFPASVNTAQLQANSSSNESVGNTNGYTNNSPRSPATTATNSTTAAPALAKSFTHLAHQSADPWSHPSNSTQPYLAFHSAAHNLAGYSHSTPSANSSLCGDKSDSGSNSSSTYNQYNSLLLAGSSINGNSLNNANNQSAVTKPAASLTSANQLPHSLAHPTMPNHLTNYTNYYHLNPLNQANALTGSASETAAPPAISFHHSTANSFHYHYHHHNAGNYNGYNYNYGLMPGKYRSTRFQLQSSG